ncbi:GHKL domain protein [Leptospira ryugenii]|uniref:GHKL domain protein n=1 Tax=Leptospira ryugenii TaxID=1917863 RepID=A0A2P2E4B3_9LEPT|nr:hypothetical protein [Leptospira ryugenii]GBF51713.1 GHKL domain protein [Leptospira ryugenii]
MYTRFLEEDGEEKLLWILRKTLEHYDQTELFELIYTACKEFVMNSTKAAIKRIVYDDLKSESSTPETTAILSSLKSNFFKDHFSYFKSKMKEKKIHTTIDFEANVERMIVTVTNNFALLPNEETRIREKFQLAKEFDNLPEFFQKHADETEGAGLGITLIGIMMAQYGIDRRYLTIFSDPKNNFTVARLEIPFSVTYRSKRSLFEETLQRENLSREILRERWNRLDL